MEGDGREKERGPQRERARSTPYWTSARPMLLQRKEVVRPVPPSAHPSERCKDSGTGTLISQWRCSAVRWQISCLRCFARRAPIFAMGLLAGTGTLYRYMPRSGCLRHPRNRRGRSGRGWVCRGVTSGRGRQPKALGGLLSSEESPASLPCIMFPRSEGGRILGRRHQKTQGELRRRPAGEVSTC
jgi:hypothetical protein